MTKDAGAPKPIFAEDSYRKAWERFQRALKTIELRSFDAGWGGDEIVAHNASVHLERMDNATYHLRIQTATEYLQVSILSDSGRAKVVAVAYDGGKQP